MRKKIKVVLVGCGGMSGTWLNVSKRMPDIEIAGLVDINEEAAKKKAIDFGLSNVLISTDLVDTLNKISPDVVFDCTIPEAHFDVTLESLKHGCHVLGEKPMVDSMEKAKEIVKYANETGKLFAVIQNRRYDQNIRRLRNFLESKQIGAITTVNCDFYIGAHFGGFRDHMKHVLLLDMAIHTFDAARFITSADAESVYCVEWNPSGSWYDYDASAVAIFEMTNGIIYTYRGSWCAEGLNTTWESDWRIIGEKGTIKWDGGSGFQAQSAEYSGGFLSNLKELDIPQFDPKGKVSGHEGLIREFIRCVQTGEIPETICSDNIKSLAMVFGAIESAEKKKRIEIKL